MSKTTKDLTGSIVGLANSMASQAKKVFGAADQTFHTISSSMTNIVNKGEQQFGFSGGEFQALNAAAVNAGATMKRNLVAQAQASGQPVNVAAIDREVADKTATAVNANQIAGYERGNQDFWKATGNLEQAPDVYGVANAFNTNAMGALDQAKTAQENRDAAGGGGWKNLVKAGIAVAGDIGGSFIDDPMLGNQIDTGLSAVGFGGGGGGGFGSAATKLFGKGGSAWGSPAAPSVDSVVSPTGGYSSSSVLDMLGYQ